MKEENRSRYRRAVALHYSENGAKQSQSAPTVEASEEALMADELVKIAERYGIPVVDRPELARALSELELGSQIPEELFEAVALTLHEVEKRTKGR